MNKRYTISCTTIKVRIDIDWKEADVDMVLAESSRMTPFSHTVKNSVTPTSESVHVLIDKLYNEFKSEPYSRDESEWQKRGITYDSALGLMQGNAYVEFEIDLTRVSLEQLPQLIDEVKKKVSSFVSKYVRYYKVNTTKNSGIGIANF